MNGLWLWLRKGVTMNQPDDAVRAYCDKFNCSAYDVFVKVCGLYKLSDWRTGKLFADYTTRGLIPIFIKEWCLSKLEGG